MSAPTPKTPPIVRHIQPKDVGAPDWIIAMALCLDYVWGKAGSTEGRKDPKPIALFSVWLKDGDCHVDLAFALGLDLKEGVSIELVEGTCDDTFQCPKVECHKTDPRFSVHVAEVLKKLMESPGTQPMWQNVERYLEEAVHWWMGQGFYVPTANDTLVSQKFTFLGKPGRA